MNVLMLVSWFCKKGEAYGGNFHYEQVVDLNRFCNCAIYYPYDRDIVNTFESGMERGVMTYRSKYKLENKIRNRVYMIQAMKKIVADFKPDIIHGNVASEGGRFAVMLGRIFHIPVIITEHSTIEASNVEHFPHYFYAQNVYKHSMYNACVSDDLRERLQKIYPKCEFHTVYNGIQEVLPRESKHLYRKEGYINVAMVAGFYSREIKGFQFVLPAVRRILDNKINIHLHLMGEGEYLAEYEDMVKQLGIYDHCTFYGYCPKEKLFDIEAEMDFVVSASLFESFGCAVAEAAMLGKPIVASKSGGVESIVNDENGILVEKGSEEAIYNGMMKMCEKYQQYDPKVISENAREKFSIGIISRKYMQIYESVVK